MTRWHITYRRHRGIRRRPGPSPFDRRISKLTDQAIRESLAEIEIAFEREFG